VSGYIVPFVLPIGLAFVAVALRGVVPPTRRAPGTGTFVRVGLELIGGVALLAYFLWQLPGEAKNARAYENDPTCRAGTQLSVRDTGGACTVEDAALEAEVEQSGKDNAYYYLSVSRWSGARRRARIDPTDANMIVWNAAKAQPGMPARAQVFAGRVTLVSTSAGTAATVNKPASQLSSAKTFGALGAGLIVAGLVEIGLAAVFVPKGW